MKNHALGISKLLVAILGIGCLQTAPTWAGEPTQKTWHGTWYEEGISPNSLSSRRVISFELSPHGFSLSGRRISVYMDFYLMDPLPREQRLRIGWKFGGPSSSKTKDVKIDTFLPRQ